MGGCTVRRGGIPCGWAAVELREAALEVRNLLYGVLTPLVCYNLSPSREMDAASGVSEVTTKDHYWKKHVVEEMTWDPTPGVDRVALFDTLLNFI